MNSWEHAYRWFGAAAVVAAGVLAPVGAASADVAGAPFVRTGEGVRMKTFAFIHVKVYAIAHEMKQLPKARSRRAVIDMDVDKRFTIRLLRDIDAAKMRDALTSAYKTNGYNDPAKIQSFLAVMTHEIKEGSVVTLAYDSANKRTTIAVQGDGTTSIDGPDFMKATWSIWLGKMDQSDLGDALVSKIP